MSGCLTKSLNNIEKQEKWYEDAKENLKKKEFLERLVRAGRRHIYWKKGKKKHVNLVAVQRMYLHYLQDKVVKEVAQIVETMEQDEKLSDTSTMESALNNAGSSLHSYCKAGFVIDCQILAKYGRRGGTRQRVYAQLPER